MPRQFHRRPHQRAGLTRSVSWKRPVSWPPGRSRPCRVAYQSAGSPTVFPEFGAVLGCSRPRRRKYSLLGRGSPSGRRQGPDSRERWPSIHVDYALLSQGELREQHILQLHQHDIAARGGQVDPAYVCLR